MLGIGEGVGEGAYDGLGCGDAAAVRGPFASCDVLALN
jgi:hypothetical protein